MDAVKYSKMPTRFSFVRIEIPDRCSQIEMKHKEWENGNRNNFFYFWDKGAPDFFKIIFFYSIFIKLVPFQIYFLN